MNKRNTPPGRPRALAGVLLALAALCLSAAPALGQATSGGTSISNTASATYSDGTNSYSVNSNTVTVTVANVAGLAITPDAGSISTVVAGQTDVDFTFTVTNSGNFATQVRFPAGGAAIFPSAGLTVTQAVIDVNGNGIDGGDVDILGNGAPVLYPSSSPYLARNASFNVVVRATVSSTAAGGATVGVTLGDAAADNEAADGTNTEVRTSVPSGVTLTGNESEGVGSITTTVQNDAQLRLNLTAPTGPVALGSNITYTWSVENLGARAVSPRTLTNAPAGSNTGVFVVVPVPSRTTFASVTPPAGVTVLYSTSALTTDPITGAVWTTAAPPAGSVTRVAFNVGASLAPTSSVTNMQFVVAVNTGINATLPVYEIGDAFGRNSVNANVTDQSGDTAYNQGDSNADFNEPKRGVPPNPDEAASPTQGYQLYTTLAQVGSVLFGPSGAPAAVGPTNNNDDYTNRSVSPAAISGLSHLNTLGSATTVDFTNTVQNTGNADDTITFTAPTVPAGFTVQISTNGGTSFTTLSGGGSATLAVAYGASANVIVRVTAPAGTAVLQSGGFNTVVRATSGVTPASSNDTHDNYYTGFLRLVK